VRKKDSGPPPEEPDQSAESFRIEVSSMQFEWLTKQCEFLGISKQQLVSQILDEWIWRNRGVTFTTDLSGTVKRALDEFMQRHGAEFLSVDDPS
jgi:hypothetical protein